jgi:1,4-dihydroxy-2-naphthoyl-CoA hydrolase
MLAGMDLTEQMQSLMPLCATLGMRAVRNGPDAAEFEMDWTPERCTTAGLLHGGAVMARADSAGAACAFANLPADANGTSTIESKTNFLGAVRGGVVHAVSRPLHAGSTTIVVETEVRDDDGRLIAKTTQTQIVLKSRATP